MTDAGLIPILREGIDVVKLILFRRLKDQLSLELPQRDGEHHRRLAASVINELFGQVSLEGPLAAFAEENQYAIQRQLESLSTNMQDLRIPLTDALRIQFLCDHQEGRDSKAVLEKARELGILITDREVPLPAKFIHMIRKIGASLNLLRVT